MKRWDGWGHHTWDTQEMHKRFWWRNLKVKECLDNIKMDLKGKDVYWRFQLQIILEIWLHEELSTLWAGFAPGTSFVAEILAEHLRVREGWLCCQPTKPVISTHSYSSFGSKTVGAWSFTSTHHERQRTAFCLTICPTRYLITPRHKTQHATSHKSFLLHFLGKRARAVTIYAPRMRQPRRPPNACSAFVSHFN